MLEKRNISTYGSTPLFAFMFGSHIIKSYIGDLWIVNTADTLMKDVIDQSQTDAFEDKTDIVVTK